MIPIKRIVFSCFVLLVSASNSYAQTNELSKFEMGFEEGFHASYRTLIISNSTSTSEYVKEFRNERELASLLPHSSLFFSWNPNAKWRFSGGLSFVKRGYQSNLIPVMNQVSDPSDPEFIRFKYYSTWLEVPVMADWFLWKRPKRLNWFARAGMIYGQNLTNNTLVESFYASGMQVKDSERKYERKSSFILSTGIGFSYDFSTHFGAECLMNFQHALTSINKSNDIFGKANIYGYYWSLGPSIRIKYLF